MKRIYRISLILIALASYLVIPFSNYGPQLEIYALDVGQGDSTLIVTPEKIRILIDGGRDGTVIEQLDRIIPIWDREIDLVMLSHPDADHITGLIDVMARFKVLNIAISSTDFDSEAFSLFEQEVDKLKIKQTKFIRGSLISTPDGVDIRGLWPTVDSLESVNTNDNSQVGLIKYNNFLALFTGDIDTDVASQLEQYHDLVNIDFLKVPHHGSRFNLTAEQIMQLSPEISTISVGAGNRYGHPSEEVIRNLVRARSSVYRTDKDGVISVIVNKSGISVRSE